MQRVLENAGRGKDSDLPESRSAAAMRFSGRSVCLSRAPQIIGHSRCTRGAPHDATACAVRCWALRTCLCPCASVYVRVPWQEAGSLLDHGLWLAAHTPKTRPMERSKYFSLHVASNEFGSFGFCRVSAGPRTVASVRRGGQDGNQDRRGERDRSDPGNASSRYKRREESDRRRISILELPSARVCLRPSGWTSFAFLTSAHSLFLNASRRARTIWRRRKILEPYSLGSVRPTRPILIFCFYLFVIRSMPRRE